MASIHPTSDNEIDTPSVEATLEWIRDDLHHCFALHVLRHFITHPIKDIYPTFDSAVAVVIDLQFYPQNPKDIVPELEDKLTQVGCTVFPLAALKKCKSPADFTTLLKTATTTYIRVFENCHLRSSAPRFVDSENKPLFCPTRFMIQQETRAFLEGLLNDQRLEDGTKAPIRLISDGWTKHEKFLKKHPDWKHNTFKLESIVFKIDSLGHLAAEAGITPRLQSGLFDQHYMYLDDMLQNFGVELAGKWYKNAANSAVCTS